MAHITVCSRVLAINELAELILLCLPTKDLLFAQTVYQYWKVTITTSPRLQRALFSLPTTIPEMAISLQNRLQTNTTTRNVVS